MHPTVETPPPQSAGLGWRLLRRIFGAGRERTLGPAQGQVLDLGTGTGESLPHYHRPLRVVGLDPQPAALQRAAEVVAGAGYPAALVRARAEALPFLSHSFDTVAGSLVFCSVGDPPAALAEVRRVLRPGGELRLVEHVRPAHGVMRLVVDLATLAWRRISHECRLDRDTLGALRAAGFRIRELRQGASGMIVEVVAEGVSE